MGSPRKMGAFVRLDAIETADIRGSLTRLRPARRVEACLIFEWAVDPEVAPFWGGLDYYPDLSAFLKDWEPHYFDGSDPARGRVLIIEALSDGRPIGMIAINAVELRERSTEIDMLIGVAGYRERGYGTDALRAFLQFLFEDVGLHRVWLATYVSNARARRAYEKAGFVLEGVLRESDWVDGRWVDSVVYGILEREYQKG